METVVIISMGIVCFNYLLKQTYRKWPAVAISSLCAAIFTGLMWRFAIEQSKTQITDWLSEQPLMLDLAVILSVDVILQIAFCMITVRILSTEPLKKWQVFTYKMLRWFPGILIYPVLFSLLVMLVFALPGVSFRLISWSFAGVLLFAIPLFTFVLKSLIPEKDLRIELLFLTNMLLAMLGIISTVNGNTAVEGQSSVQLASLLGLILLLAIFGFAGFYMRKIGIKNKIKYLNKR